MDVTGAYYQGIHTVNDLQSDFNHMMYLQPITRHCMIMKCKTSIVHENIRYSRWHMCDIESIITVKYNLQNSNE